MRPRTIGAFLASLILLSPFAAQSASLLQIATQKAAPRLNPYAGDENSHRAGEKLFARECSACHGRGGQGSERRHTPSLATAAVRQANPGALFWILRNGSASHRMPSFSHLPEQQRWQIVAYLKTIR